MQTSNQNSNKKGDQLEKVVSIVKLPLNSPQQYHLDRSVPWVAEILEELGDESDPASSIEIELELCRRKSSDLDEHLVVKANIRYEVIRNCVRCLEPSKEVRETYSECCCLDQEMQEQEIFQDTESVVCENKEMELYFLTQRKVNLQEILHEQLFVNYDYYPLHDEDCKGLCPQTGENLNFSSASV